MTTIPSSDRNESLEELEERLAQEIADVLATGGTFVTQIDDPNSQLNWRIHPGFYIYYGIRQVYKDSVFHVNGI